MIFPQNMISTLKKITEKAPRRISKSQQTNKSVSALDSRKFGTAVLTATGGLLAARLLGPEVTGPFRAYTIPLMYLTFLHLGAWVIAAQIPAKFRTL